MRRACSQLDLRQQCAPWRGLVGIYPVRKRNRIDRTAIGIISFEKCGVHFDSMNCAGGAEFDDGPIVSVTATAACLPSVVHSFAAARHYEVAWSAEEFVACR